MEEKKSNEPSKVGTFLSSAANRVLNLLMILVIIALAALVAWFWHENELLQNDIKNLNEKVEGFEKMSSMDESRDIVVREEVEEESDVVIKEDESVDSNKNRDDKNLGSLDTSSWKTYTEEFGRIQFKYPENWNTEKYLKKQEQDKYPEYPDLYANSRYLEEEVCESVFKLAAGYGSTLHSCSVGVRIIPKFSSKGCVNVENANYKICPLQYSSSDLIDVFTKSAVLTKGTDEFMISFVVNVEKGNFSKDQFEKKYSPLYNKIFDSVKILN